MNEMNPHKDFGGIPEVTQWIMELMRAHGQLSVFIGVMIEQIIVPIPSPLIFY